MPCGTRPPASSETHRFLEEAGRGHVADVDDEADPVAVGDRGQGVGAGLARTRVRAGAAMVRPRQSLRPRRLTGVPAELGLRTAVDAAHPGPARGFFAQPGRGSAGGGAGAG